MKTFLFRSYGANGALTAVPFEAELYATAPERFGGWHDDGAPTPTPDPAQLTREQLHGELALLVLRWLCIAALSCTVVGLVAVLWHAAFR